MTSQAAIDTSARSGAQGLWNETACGELEGDKNSVEYFDRVAADRYAEQPWMHDYFHFEDFAGKKVLEIGVGQGTDLNEFAKRGAECSGADITENHLNLTARNFALRGRSADLRQADATALPFADGTFDCVYSFGVMHHIPEIDRVIAEARRVLKPGGKLMIALYHKWSAYHLLQLLLKNGIGRGELFRLGYAGVLAKIEGGADGKRLKPYVRLYSKADMRALGRNFEIEDVSVHQFYAMHVLPAALLGRRRFAQLPLAGLFGWYVTGKFRKPL